MLLNVINNDDADDTVDSATAHIYAPGGGESAQRSRQRGLSPAALAAAARAGASGRGRCDGAADMAEHALNHRFRHVRAQTEVILKGRKANLDVKNLTTDKSSLPKTVGAVDKKRPWLGGESVRM
ncbi:hypothetical protein NHJ13734_008922 [Beauveria thailandica]